KYHLGAGIFRPTAVTDRMSTYWRFFDPAFLFMVGGYTRMTNSTRLVGVFLLPLLVLIPLGVLLAMFGLERLLAAPSRLARAAAGVLLAMVPLHFAFFLVHYFGDYHRHAAFWFEWDHLGALQQVIAHAPGHDRSIWLSNGDDKMMETYWRLAAA